MIESISQRFSKSLIYNGFLRLGIRETVSLDSVAINYGSWVVLYRSLIFEYEYKNYGSRDRARVICTWGSLGSRNAPWNRASPKTRKLYYVKRNRRLRPRGGKMGKS